MATSLKVPASIEDYLQFEDQALERHEYLNGEIFAMSGGTIRHSLLAANLLSSLATQLRDSDCTVLGSDARIRTSPAGLYSYADVAVVCGEPSVEHNSLLNPLVLVEVLSDSTENYDRGKKFEFYRQIESFAEYIIVAQDRPYLEHHVRNGNAWIMRIYEDRATRLLFETIPASLLLDDIYRKVL